MPVEEDGWADLVWKDEEHKYMAYPKGLDVPYITYFGLSEADLSLGPNPATYLF